MVIQPEPGTAVGFESEPEDKAPVQVGDSGGSGGESSGDLTYDLGVSGDGGNQSDDGRGGGSRDEREGSKADDLGRVTSCGHADDSDGDAEEQAGVGGPLSVR